MTSTNQSNQPNYFNLHAKGEGYLSRIREVQPSLRAGRRSVPYLSCAIAATKATTEVTGIGYVNRIHKITPTQEGAKSILMCTVAAMRGKSDMVDYTYFNFEVADPKAIEILTNLQPDVKAERKIVVSFKAVEIEDRLYERFVRDDKGNKTEAKEWAATIDGVMTRINSVSVDGVNIFKRDPDAPEIELKGTVSGRTYFDLRVSGEEAETVIKAFEQDVKQGRKVLVTYKISDMYPHTYERKERLNNVETGKMVTASLIKGRLLQIQTVKVDDVVKYERPVLPQDANAPQEPADENADTPAFNFADAASELAADLQSAKNEPVEA